MHARSCCLKVFSVPTTGVVWAGLTKRSQVLVFQGQVFFFAGTLHRSSCALLFTRERANPRSKAEDDAVTLPQSRRPVVLGKLASLYTAWLFIWNIWGWNLVTGKCFLEWGYATSLESLRRRDEAAACSRQDIITTSAQVLLANASILLLFLFNNPTTFGGWVVHFYSVNATIAMTGRLFGMYSLTFCSFDDSAAVMWCFRFCAVMLTFSVTRASHAWAQWIVICLNDRILQSRGFFPRINVCYECTCILFHIFYAVAHEVLWFCSYVPCLRCCSQKENAECA